MVIQEWCQWAQDDQNRHRVSHLYANYRHSLKTSLMPRSTVADFVRLLSQYVAEGGLLDPARPGVAEDAVAAAHKALWRSPVPGPDFRFSGPPIGEAAGTVLLNVGVRPAESRSTARTPVGQVRPRRGPRLVWLTRIPEVVALLHGAAARSPGGLDELAFFRELVHALGLRPQDLNDLAPAFDCTVRLFRLAAGGRLCRPHALSGGYGDRFCGASPQKPYGSTADNRTGRSGLPEAICRADDIVELDARDPAYAAFRVSVAPLAPWIVEGAAIAATLPGHSLYDPSTRCNARVRRVIIRRLGERMRPCGAGPRACDCPKAAAAP